MSSAKVARSASPFPAIPSSLHPGDYEMRDFYDADKPAVVVPNTAPLITPYVGLRARLSQIWINRWTVLLLLVLVRLLLAVQSLDDNLGSARREALSACTGVESMGSAMASMPHYMSQGVNELTATGVETAVNGLMSMLLLSVTGVEELVVFVVNMLTSTYVCLITLAIRGSFGVALELVKDVSDFLNRTLGDVGSEIQKGVEGFSDDLNNFSEVLNSVPKIFGSDSEIPEIDLAGPLDELDNIQIPNKFNEELEKLNSSIPTFDEVRNFTDGVLRTPFELVKKSINETMVAYKFDRSVFPIPQREQMSFCSDNNGINDFFDKLVRLAAKAQKIFIGVLVVAAILVCIPMTYREIWRWRTTRKRAQLLREGAFDPLDVLHIASRPTSSTIGLKVAARFGPARRQILVRWAIAYATTTPALLLLSLGLAGLFACLCQYILLKSVEKEVPALAGQVGEFAGKVVLALNNASEQWAVGVNGVMDSTNREINDEVFGWVNTTTGGVNDTLNAFVDKMSEALNATFGDTVLYEPIKEVLNCLIGLKIAGIQRGLTWVSDNARVDFPRLPNDTFSLGAVASVAADSKEAGDSFLADPSSQATDKITDAVARMVGKIEDSIRTEALISTVLLLLWLVVALGGLTYILSVGCFKRDKTRAEGGDDDHLTRHPDASQSVTTIVTGGGHEGNGKNKGRQGRGPRHSSFLFPHAFRNGPNSAESGSGEEEHYARPLQAEAVLGQHKTGFVGMRTVVVDQHNEPVGGGGAHQTGSHARKSSYGIIDEKPGGTVV